MPDHAQIAAQATAAQEFWWVPPLVVAIGVVVAILAIEANRRIARMRATLDLIERTESSEHYRDIRRAFRILIDDPSEDTLHRLADAKNDSDRATGQKIYTYLNHYELVAIGCNAGILDEDYYAVWMRSTLVRDWEGARRFIEICRDRPNRKNPSAFINFENMAKRFRDDPRYRRGAQGSARSFGGPLRRLADWVWPSRA